MAQSKIGSEQQARGCAEGDGGCREGRREVLPLFEALEQRLMLSASPLDDLSDACAPASFPDASIQGLSVGEQARILAARFAAGELKPGEGVLIDGAGRQISFDPLPVDEVGAAIMPDEGAVPDSVGNASYDLADTFLLHSNAGASKTIFLDFDGHTTTDTVWNSVYNGGDPIVSPAFNFVGCS